MIRVHDALVVRFILAANHSCFSCVRNDIPCVSLAPSSSDAHFFMISDEAEARVRKLIADTERMLVGLSGTSSDGPGLAV